MKKKPSGGEGASVATAEPDEAPSTTRLADLGEIPLANVHPDPDNPRSRLTRASVEELAAAISVHGILNPLTVRRNGGPTGETFTIVAGHRRFLAAQVAGLKTAPCREYLPARSDEFALPRMTAARIAENDQREDLAPIDESRAVRELIGQGLTPAAAGELLGRSEAWVRRRAGLVGLSPKIAKLIAGKPDPDHDAAKIATWPVSWLEDLAAVPVDVQDHLLDGNSLGYIDSRETLQGRLFDMTADLASVPWDVKEPDLVKGVVSCTDCPKRSSATPGLFDLVGEKGERCLDRDCFRGKHKAFRDRALKLAKKSHPDVLQVHGLQQGGRGLRAPGRALEAFEFAKAKASDKGAKPALVVDGANAGKIIYVKPKAKRAPAKPAGGSRPAKVLGAAELLELKALRRAASEVHKILGGLHRPEPWVLFALSIEFEIDGWTLRDAMPRGSKVDRYAKAGQAVLLDAVWSASRKCLGEPLDVPADEKDPVMYRFHVQDAGEQAQRLAEFLDSFAPKDAPPFDWAEIVKRARATEEANAAAAPLPPGTAEKKPAKGKRKAG